MTVPIPQTDPGAAYHAYQGAIDAAIARVLKRGWYVLGEEVAAFESEFAAYIGCRHAVGVGSGTDALVLAMKALGIGPGKRVATVSHTAVATVSAIETAGAEPVLVDIDAASYTMDPQELERTLRQERGAVAAIIAVHLFGRTAELDAIGDVARRHGIPLVEDCAQCHGAFFDGKRAGSFGAAGCFSFYPTKQLGAIGDGGAVTTDDENLAVLLKELRQYGWNRDRVSTRAGLNSRLDEIQAAILRVKLPHLDADNRRRAELAALYDRALGDLPLILPVRSARGTHVFHQYVIRSRQRDRLRAGLAERGIGTNIHYPVPVHLQPAYHGRLRHGPSGLGRTEAAAKEILSLPLYPQLDDQAPARVGEAIRAILKGGAS